MNEVPNLRIIPGDPLSPFILHVPHSSRFIPPDVRRDILLDDEALARELDEMTDSHTDKLAEAAAQFSLVKPWIFLNTYSRLVVDPERFPDDREEMNTIGMGAVYQTTSDQTPLRLPDAQRAKELVDTFFHPYAKNFEDLTTHRLREVGKIVIVDVHSYRAKIHRNSLNEGLLRPPICIGVDDFHSPIWLRQRAEEFFGQVGKVEFNQPYAGTYVPLSRYQSDRNVSSIMMENRADIFLSQELEITKGLDDLARALANLIDAGVMP